VSFTPPPLGFLMMPSNELSYRREIDGLRALAVLPVIFFHAEIPGFSGGFVGVDVFFVISGYLITSIILTERAGSRFSFAGFYERRARRILPPLILVCLVSCPFAFFILNPTDLSNFSKSLLAVSTFVSNFFFWGQSGYFDTDTELKPMLHTWSLAVEEQFYLLFPIALLVMLRLGRKFALAGFAIIAIFSFAFAQWGSYHATETAFYLLPARMWELLIGAFVPIAAIDPRKLVRGVFAELLALLGIVLIAIPVLTYHSVPYPGVYALPPAVGALLIILYANANTVAGRVLGSHLFVGMGLISYSAYLWHQPIFAFARQAGFYEANPWAFAVLSGVAIGLAALTYLMVERPVRNRALVTRRKIVALSALGTISLVGLGVVGVANGGFEEVYLARHGSDTQRAYYLVKKYALRDLVSDTGSNHDCVFWSKMIDDAFREKFASCAMKYSAAVLVVGDSHAMNVYNGLAAAHTGEFVVGIFNPGCRPWNKEDGCQYFADLVDFLKESGPSVESVVFNFSGAHLMADAAGVEESRHLFEQGSEYRIDLDHIRWTIGYVKSLGALTKVIWLGPFAEARVNLRDLPELAKNGFQMNPVSLDRFKDLDARVAKEIFERAPNFRYLSIYDVLDISRHFLLTGDCLTFSDGDHFSVCGEKLLGERLKAFLPDR
jgi:peptidoglycan/LPS O-acetylase OafA/YrhL